MAKAIEDRNLHSHIMYICTLNIYQTRNKDFIKWGPDWGDKDGVRHGKQCLEGRRAKKDAISTTRDLACSCPSCLSLHLWLNLFLALFGLLKVILQQLKLQGCSTQQPDTPSHIEKLNKAKARKLCNWLRMAQKA